MLCLNLSGLRSYSPRWQHSIGRNEIITELWSGNSDYPGFGVSRRNSGEGYGLRYLTTRPVSDTADEAHLSSEKSSTRLAFLVALHDPDG